MAVLVEAISIIIRKDAIERFYSGGWSGFCEEIPNGTMCCDGEVVRLGFLRPAEVGGFVSHMRSHGLTHLQDGVAVDLAVVDQFDGLIDECDWLAFGRFNFGKGGGKISACWFSDVPCSVWGDESRQTRMELATPSNWRFERSLSQLFDMTLKYGDRKGLRISLPASGTNAYAYQQGGYEQYAISAD